MGLKLSFQKLNKSYKKKTLDKKRGEKRGERLGNELGNRLGNRLGNELGNSRTVIIKEMRANPKISATTLAEILNISTTAIEKNIKLLKEDGVVKRINGTRGHWEIIDE
jgi:biotin operon repressor